MTATKAKHFSVLFILSILLFFVDLGLFEPDLMEARNFVTAREMILKHNWILPTMNDELRLEKQPFVTWLTAISAMAGNTLTDLTILRLPSAIISFLMVLFFYGICLELTNSSRAAFLGGLIFATSLLVVQMARINTWDVFTHAFMTGSIWLQIRAMKPENKSYMPWIGASLLMGLSIFSKGPVALYAMWLPFIFSYFIFQQKRQIKKYMLKVLPMVIFALITGFGWNLYVYFMEPEALKAVLDKETTAWVERNTRPFYFYFHFPAYIGIWALPLMATFFFKPFRKRVMEFGNYKFILAWMLISFVLLSVIPEKKERYMLPLEVPMCLLVTLLIYSIYSAFENKLNLKSDLQLVKIQGWLAVILLISLPVAAAVILKNQFLSFHYILTSLVLIALAIYHSYILVKNTNLRNVQLMILSSVVVVISITSVFLPVLAKKTYVTDFKDIGDIGMIDEYKNIPFISEGELNMKLIYRVGKPVLPVSEPSLSFKEFPKFIYFCYFPIEKIWNKNILSELKITDLGEFHCDRSGGKCRVYVYVIENIP